MKHEEYMDARDRAELESALHMVKEGRKLRDRVKSRLATRAWRKGKEDDLESLETHS